MSWLAAVRTLGAEDSLSPSSLALVFLAAACFVLVTSYLVREARARRLIDGPNSPLRFVTPGLVGWPFVLVVLALLFLQSPLYILVVVIGVSGFLIESGPTAAEQFGFTRLALPLVFVWSLVICGAVVFVELPLGQLVDRGMTAIHLPHPEQESVEVFRQVRKPSAILVFLVQAVLLSPLIEELFFRGFLFTFLKNYTSTTLALVLSAGVFAFAHANLGSVLQLWILGIVLGLAYEHTGSLFLPFGIHAGWNFLTAASLLWDRGGT